jgi:putative ABC transport system permease protein
MWHLALKNISRNKKRTFFSALTIFIATVAVIAFLAMENGMFESIRENAINHTAGNINIKTKLYDEHERVMPLQFYIPSTSALSDKIESIDGVESTSRKTSIPVAIYLGDDNKNAIAMGVDFNNDRFFGDESREYFEGTMPEEGSKDVIITTHLAQFLNLKIGDRFTFLSKTATGGSNAISSTITAIISFKDSDLNTNAFYISPTTLSSMLRMNDGSIEMLVYTDGTVSVEDINRAIDDDSLLVQSWKDVSVVGKMLDFADVFYGYIKILFFIMASTVIINTTMMSVIERRKEAATMIAIGYSHRWVRNLFLLESAMISVLAAILGTIVGAIIINTAGKAGINMDALGGSAVEGYGFNTLLYLSLPLAQYFSTILYAVVIAIVACIFPTRKILKLEPAVALHDEI